MLVGDIQSLPETQRTALVLREMDALSYEQIAEAMETTVPSVKSLLVRARVSLAEAAQARMLTCEDVRARAGRGGRGPAPPARPAGPPAPARLRALLDLQGPAGRHQQGAGRAAPDRVRAARAAAQARDRSPRSFRRRRRGSSASGAGAAGQAAAVGSTAAAGATAVIGLDRQDSCRPAWARSPPRRPPAWPPPRWSPPARSRSISRPRPQHHHVATHVASVPAQPAPVTTAAQPRPRPRRSSCTTRWSSSTCSTRPSRPRRPRPPRTRRRPRPSRRPGHHRAEAKAKPKVPPGSHPDADRRDRARRLGHAERGGRRKLGDDRPRPPPPRPPPLRQRAPRRRPASTDARADPSSTIPSTDHDHRSDFHHAGTTATDPCTSDPS